jgi:hypothetical protein
MKIAYFLLTILLVSLTACATIPYRENQDSLGKDPETVMITYHVQSGKEREFQEVLSRAWVIYRKEHLVFAQPHVIIRDKENGNKTRFVEIFTWVSHDAPANVPDSVKTLWNKMHSLCEEHDGLEGGEVELLTPAQK